jgi:DNA-binding FadR family transcriptional regulator
MSMAEPVFRANTRRANRGRANAMEAILRPVRVGNAFEECVERLLSAIKLGLITAGDRLPAERELAARLDVSRTTLREAIRSLQSAGFVESRRGRNGGTFVIWDPADASDRTTLARTPTRADEAGDTIVLRDVLEVGAAVAAASRSLGVRQRGHLLRCLNEASAADLDSYRRADSRLHLAIAEATGSPSLIAGVADVRMRVNDLLDDIPLLRRNIEHSNEQHVEIVDAIIAGDQDRARLAMTDHLSGTASLLRAFID